MTKGKISAILVYNQEDPSRALKLALENQGTEIHCARSCREVRKIIEEHDPPEVVFTDTDLADGTWVDVLRLSATAHDPVEVIVVSRLPDIKLYIDVMESGAFDFIAPPFQDAGLAHIVQCAAWRAISRRRSQKGYGA